LTDPAEARSSDLRSDTKMLRAQEDRYRQLRLSSKFALSYRTCRRTCDLRDWDSHTVDSAWSRDTSASCTADFRFRAAGFWLPAALEKLRVEGFHHGDTESTEKTARRPQVYSNGLGRCRVSPVFGFLRVSVVNS